MNVRPVSERRSGPLRLTLAAGFLALTLAGCTQAPFDLQEPSAAMAADRLPVAFPERPGRVYPLTSGPEAFATWLDLIGSASERIDIMTFILRADGSGRAVAGALVAAADRGVKVRILVDDAFMAMRDDRLGGLTRHPNIDLRAFNPFSRAAPSMLGYVLDRARLNRRMHNKVLIVDGRVAILGGRNVGDEYFGQDRAQHFADFDLLIRGAAVRDMTAGFAAYWNDRRAVPYDRLRPRLSAEGVGDVIADPEVSGQLPESAARRIAAGRARDFPARIVHIIDDPEEMAAPPREGQRAQHVANAYLSEIAAARREVLIVTPYFVPQQDGVALLSALVHRGVSVTVITNSLAATNHKIAHGSYARYRDKLAAQGVVFHETRPEAGPWLDPDGASPNARTTMHANLVHPQLNHYHPVFHFFYHG